jgi:hypothetical protein
MYVPAGKYYYMARKKAPENVAREKGPHQRIDLGFESIYE